MGKANPTKLEMPFIAGRLDAFKWVGTVLGAIALGATFGVYIGLGTAIGGFLGAVGGATVVVTDSCLHRKSHG
jgi:hypothetical protein